MTDIAARKAALFDLLYRKGKRDTREIAEYLHLKIDTARRFLRKMADAGELDLWDGRGISINNCDLWSNADQHEPLDPMTRLKEDYQAPRVFILHCQRLSDITQPPSVEYYDVRVTVVPQTRTGAPWRDRISGQTGWRAYSREWGAGKRGYGDAREAARCLASKSGVMASIKDITEVEDIHA